ncbi:MAG: MBOAT family protein [Lachnospiraceae bacterium]|nr:MBOAT family protein [Lachnospiraceae bacterium]
MVFSSILFLFRFLPIFFIVYYMAPKRMRNLVLFFGSLVFYAWGEPVYVLLMLFSTLSDYIHGRLIERLRGRRSAKILLLSSLVINLGLLAFFKYSGLNLPLPIGISFYTFQTMSYTIDVYRGEVAAQRNFLDFGMFVSMFPQLIAGPIVKYKTVAGELKERNVPLSAQAQGAQRFVIGLGKKVLLANNIGRLFTEIAGYDAANLAGLSAWMGILAYAFQIYFDFSGYSDMAIGLGQIMGFHFPENFNYPYIATSITDFWRRWHMSLGSWFREYVYIPLGGNRKGLPRQLLNILIVWALTGIWHGAGLNFLLWGIWFAAFLALEKMFLGEWLTRMPKFFGWVYSMAVVLLGWCFFSLEQADKIFLFIKAMFGFGSAGFVNNNSLYLLHNYMILFLVLAAGATPWLKKAVKRWEESVVLKNLFLVAVLLLSIAGIVDASYNPFLYFRF